MAIDKRKQGKRNKAAGARFERKVRKHLENNGWIVSKWQNNIKEDKCVPSKPSKFRLMQTGFPDFIAYYFWDGEGYFIFFVEVKSNGYLSKEEKEKAIWYLEHNYCDKFFVAYKKEDPNDKRKVLVKYKEIEYGAI